MTVKIVKTKRSPYVLNEGKIYVECKYSGISFLVIMIDCLTVYTFGKGKTTFILLDDAIRWHEKEIKTSNGGHPDTGLKILTKAKNDLEAAAKVEAGSNPASCP